MKNQLLKKIFLIFTLFLGVYFSFSFKKYIHFTLECGSDFHGIGLAHKDCTEDIVITSTDQEGPAGTIIAGEVYSEGKIRIIPGVSSVRLVPELSSHHDKALNKNQILTHRTKIGGNGGRVTLSKNTNSISKKTFLINDQGIIFKNLNSFIINYSIYSKYGEVISEENNVDPTNNIIPLADLENDIYIIKLQLGNGEIFTKTIAKQ